MMATQDLHRVFIVSSSDSPVGNSEDRKFVVAVSFIVVTYQILPTLKHA